MSDSLHPSEGIRLLLDRVDVSESRDTARYEAAVYTVESRFDYSAVLNLDGSATIEPTGAEALDEDRHALDKLAKSTARAAKRKLAEDLPPWPQRILRWRGPGRG